jgi:hypothetical protein
LGVSGRVLYGGPAGTPLPHAWVVLHRVTMGGGGGPIDSVRTGGDGAFTLSVAHADTGAMYVVSTWRDGIVYFSEPVRASGPRARLQPLLVYDTSSTGPQVQVARRVITVARPKQDGARDVLELVELHNPGTKTRIPTDTLRPTWIGAVPTAAVQFQVAQGDLSPQAVALHGDSVNVFGPLPPGDAKQLSYAYVVPGTETRLALPIDQATAELDLLIEDTTALVTAPQLEQLGVHEIEGRRFASYRTRALPAGAAVSIAFSARPRFRAESLVPFVVILAGVILGVGFVVALRRAPIASVPPSR